MVGAHKITAMDFGTCSSLNVRKSMMMYSSDSKKSDSTPIKAPSSGLPPSGTYGSQGQTAPEKFDGGDYDETKNEEYENTAERNTTFIRRLKKVCSTGVFVAVLAFVGYKRKVKREEVADNIKDAKFFKEESQFKGSIGSLCVYEKPECSGAKVVLPVSILRDGTIKHIQNLKLRQGDVIVASFPKAGKREILFILWLVWMVGDTHLKLMHIISISWLFVGTTWVQEIVYLLQTDLDFEKAGEKVLETRSPFLEYPYPGLDFVEKMESPRILKTHLPFGYLPENLGDGKIIYVARNPKDVVVSYYHFAKMFTPLGFVGSFDDFLGLFERDECKSRSNHNDKLNFNYSWIA